MKRKTGHSSNSASPRLRNIIIVCADDLRFDAAGYTGNSHIHTPHLDALAARSVRFSNAFTTLAICSPSRAALLTGRYGSTNGVTKLDTGLYPDENTFAQSLREAGYRTGLVGKWHLANTPEECGFDDTIYFQSNGSYYDRAVLEHGIKKRIPQHIEDYNAQHATAFLRESVQHDQPFELFLCPQLPHLDDHYRWNARGETLARYADIDIPVPVSWSDDLSGKPPYLSKSRSYRKAVEEFGYDKAERVQQHMREYYAVVTDLDAAIGKVSNAVEELGLIDETMIVVTSDHGFFIGEHRLTSKMLPYEESIRIPLLVSAPGITPRDEDRLVLNIDLMPTILEWAGLPKTPNLHGQSLWPLMCNEPVRWRDSFLYEAPQTELGLRPNLAIRSHQWKYIQTFDDEFFPGDTPLPSFEELYNVEDDRHEIFNLATASEHQDVKEQLQADLASHRSAARMSQKIEGVHL